LDSRFATRINFEVHDLFLVAKVWTGALLMCDYLLANRAQFAGKTVLELGCGVGLASLVARLAGAAVVIATGVYTVRTM